MGDGGRFLVSLGSWYQNPGVSRGREACRDRGWGMRGGYATELSTALMSRKDGSVQVACVFGKKIRYSCSMYRRLALFFCNNKMP